MLSFISFVWRDMDNAAVQDSVLLPESRNTPSFINVSVFTGSPGS